MQAAQTLLRERVQVARKTREPREGDLAGSKASRVPQDWLPLQDRQSASTPLALQTREEQKLEEPERSARSPSGRRSGMGR